MGNDVVNFLKRGTGIHKVVKISKARDKIKSARSHHKKNLARFKKQRTKTKEDIEKLNAMESDISKSFKVFSDVFEKIQNRPEFKEYIKNDVNIPKYKGKKLKKVPVEFELLDTLVVATARCQPLLSYGILVLAGGPLSHKAKKAQKQMKRAEKKIDKACDYMKELRKAAVDYRYSLQSVNRIYQDHLARLRNIVNDSGKTNWVEFTQNEKLCVENSVLLTALLYNMCKVQLVLKENDQKEQVNSKEIEESMTEAKQFLASHDFSLSCQGTA